MRHPTYLRLALSSLNPRRTMVSVAVAAVLAGSPLLAQHKAPARPNLEGTWNGSTLTPLQRPADFRDKATFTPEEAAEYVRTAPDRVRSRLR
jgi:hypothetical protein